MHPADTQLVCATCGQAFVYTAGERELALLRGLATLPSRCPTCRRHALAPAVSTTPPATRRQRE